MIAVNLNIFHNLLKTLDKANYLRDLSDKRAAVPFENLPAYLL